MHFTTDVWQKQFKKFIDIKFYSLDVGLENMCVSRSNEVLMNWRRSDMEGVTGDASVIEKALVEIVEEPNDIALADEEVDDDTYVDDGYVAPVDSSCNTHDDDFFCSINLSLLDRRTRSCDVLKLYLNIASDNVL